MRNVLPVKERLQEKGLSIGTDCPRCGQEETTLHVFMECAKARSCWRLMNIQCSVLRGTDMFGWVEQLVNSLTSQMVDELFCCLWRIWYE